MKQAESALNDQSQRGLRELTALNVKLIAIDLMNEAAKVKVTLNVARHQFVQFNPCFYHHSVILLQCPLCRG